jgi:hypothetical protein
MTLTSERLAELERAAANCVRRGHPVEGPRLVRGKRGCKSRQRLWGRFQHRPG